MAFVREKKKRAGKSYFYLVENVRENGKVRQRVIRYIGTKRPRGPQKGLKGTKRR